MNSALLEEFCQLIAVQTGLKIREQDRQALAKCITTRVQMLALSDAAAYYPLLQSALNQHELNWGNHPELQMLAPAITTGESYFLRDRGQMDILEQHVLPDLIQQKRAAAQNSYRLKPTLKIWSAGCSTGEEVYTISTLVQKMLSDRQHWNVSILGTDLNPEAIARAKRGIYKRWSFRQTSLEFQTQYFREHSEGREVDASLRKGTLFQPMNLLQAGDWAANPHLQGLDLILCRNVFIYFQHEAIAAVIKRFHAALNPGGYLITGHSELQGQDMADFKLLLFPESVVYQRPLTTESISTVATPRKKTLPSNPVLNKVEINLGMANVSHASPAQPNQENFLLTPLHPIARQGEERYIQSPEELGENLEKARSLLQQGRYTAVLTTTEVLLRQDPNQSEVYYLRAQAYANQGDSAHAIAACEQSIQLNPNFLDPIYLLVQIAEEQQNSKQAKQLLKKILYLDPTFIAAYIDLGTLYLNEGEVTRAQKMFQSAWELIQSLPPEQPLSYRGTVSARSLQNHLKTFLA